MLDDLTSPQLTDWYAYGNIFPLPEQRADMRSASECLTTARANNWKGAKWEHFLLDFLKSKKVITAEDIDYQMRKLVGIAESAEKRKAQLSKPQSKVDAKPQTPPVEPVTETEPKGKRQERRKR